MGALRFIMTFAQIVFKGCMGSPAIRTILILLSSTAAFIFIPYWVGLLVVGHIVPGPAWPGGMLFIIFISLAITFIAVVYFKIYEAVKNSMRRKG